MDAHARNLQSDNQVLNYNATSSGDHLDWSIINLVEFTTTHISQEWRNEFSIGGLRTSDFFNH